jgi:hypothetical protein
MDGAIAAQRGGIKTVLIPEENAKDLVEIVDSIKRGLEIIPVSSSGLFALNREISVCAALVHYCLSPHWFTGGVVAAAAPDARSSCGADRSFRPFRAFS